MAEVVNDWLTLRDECLNVNEFETIERAREKNEAWRADYNERRPHGALGHLTPSEFAQSGGQSLVQNCPLTGRTSIKDNLHFRVVSLTGKLTWSLLGRSLFSSSGAREGSAATSVTATPSWFDQNDYFFSFTETMPPATSIVSPRTRILSSACRNPGFRGALGRRLGKIVRSATFVDGISDIGD
jgi:hypothetical protein